MSIDLVLQPSCGGCGSTVELFGSMCKHLTLCMNCGKTMAENHAKCYECGAPITRLIGEFDVRVPSSDRKFFVGRFATGLPNFKKKNKWTMQKDGLQSRQASDTLREKYKNRPWLLQDETGQFSFQGALEGSQSAIYYQLVLQGKDLVAIPASSWYNFNKVAQYKQLTLEEAEEKMKNRRKTADGYQRWMMKAANNGAAAFGEVEKPDDRETAAGGGRGRKKTTGGDDDEANVSDRGDEDEDEESARKNRLGLNKKGGDDDEEGLRGGDLDFDDEDIEKGDDWEHEEIFTDDDEAVGNDREEREDLAPEIPAPPEIKDDEEDEEEGEEEEGRLSKSGKELQKLLGRTKGLNESDDDDDDDDDTEEDISPVLAPKKEAPKEEPVDNSSPLKSTTAGAARGTQSTSKSSKGKRKSNGEESKTTPNNAPHKKVKTENDVKSVKEEPGSSSKSSAPNKAAPPQASSRNAPAPPQASSSRNAPAPPTRPVTEEEIRAVLTQTTPVTTQDLVAKFKSRLKLKEDKDAFAAILRRISKIQKTNGANYVVLRER